MYYYLDYIVDLFGVNLNFWVVGWLVLFEVIGFKGVDCVVVGFNEVYVFDCFY